MPDSNEAIPAGCQVIKEDVNKWWVTTGMIYHLFFVITYIYSVFLQSVWHSLISVSAGAEWLCVTLRPQGWCVNCVWDPTKYSHSFPTWCPFSGIITDLCVGHLMHSQTCMACKPNSNQCTIHVNNFQWIHSTCGTKSIMTFTEGSTCNVHVLRSTNTPEV